MTLSTVEKGNELEDALYQYLIEQERRGELIYGVHDPITCQIHKKKKYDDWHRQAPVEFDVVIEVRRKGREAPHSYLVFECKNHKSPIAETAVTDFSDKIGRLFGHAAKGVIVFSSRPQSGARALAKSKGIGLAKLDPNGLDVVADRNITNLFGHEFVESQLFEGDKTKKSLKFSAYLDDTFFGSVRQILEKNDADLSGRISPALPSPTGTVPFLTDDKIQSIVGELLKKLCYESGSVNLAEVCKFLSISVLYSQTDQLNIDGEPILGSAFFESQRIHIYPHQSESRKRFTLSHEIGHFYLNHGDFVRSESVIERDLFNTQESGEIPDYKRMEIQANLFASHLLLPQEVFAAETNRLRKELDIQDRGHGHIFVDDQPCNYAPYNELLDGLSQYFGASKQAIELKLKRMGWLSDERKLTKQRTIA